MSRDSKASLPKETSSARTAADDDLQIPCPVFDPMEGRPCGHPVEPDTLTCREHRARPTRTEISRQGAARKRYGV